MIKVFQVFCQRKDKDLSNSNRIPANDLYERNKMSENAKKGNL